MFENLDKTKKIENPQPKKITPESLQDLLKPIPPQIQQSPLFQGALVYLASNALSIKEILESMNGIISIEKLAPTLKEIGMDKTTKMLMDFNLEELVKEQAMMGHVDQYLTATADFYQQE